MGSLSAGIGRLTACGALIAVAGGASAPAARLPDAGPVVPTAPSRAPSLCTRGEVPLFACSVGSKLASVCAAGGGATYRFGRPGRVELASRSLAHAMTGWAGGGETQITATSGAYSYTVFDRTVRTNFDASGRHDPAFASGVLVRRSGKVLATLRCKSETPISSRAERLLPAGTYVEH